MTNSTLRIVLFFGIFTLGLLRLTIPAHAADFVVTHTGDSGEGSLRQAIINANTDGVDSTITFAPSADGTITLLSKLPALIANGTLTIEGNGQTNTIISGNDTVRVLHIHPRANVAISDLTITRGYGDNGGGITVDLGTLNLNEVLVSNNAAIEGGGIYNREGTLTITGSSVTSNSAYLSGAGIFNFEDGVEASLAITDSTITSNTAVRFGGGIYSSGTTSITRSTIADNTASDYDGGGISSEGELTVVDSVISGNTAGQVGGGIISQFAALTITSSTITGNSAKFAGGGLSNVGGIVTLTDTLIHDNATSDHDSIGGGVFTQSYGTAQLTVNDSTISGNTSGWGGGGISNIDTTVYLNKATVSGNVARRGGGINNNLGGTITLTDSTVSGNTATGNDPERIEGGGGIWNAGTFILNGSTVSQNTAARGGGIYNSIRTATPPGGNLTINNSTIAANTAAIEGAGLLVGSGLVTLDNSIFANSGMDCVFDPSTGAVVDANYSLFSNTAACGALEADGNLIGRDPLLGALITPPDGSPAYYPLLAGSLAIDAGSDALIPDGLTADQAGNPRIFGAAVDMGSVEFTASNLIQNGSFETAGVNPSRARKWQAVGLAAADKLRCDKPARKFAYTGSCAFQFNSPAPVSLARVIKQRVDVTGVGRVNDTLTLSLWVQAKKLTAGAKLKVKIRYADGTTGKIVIKLPSGTYSYTRLSSSLTLSKSAVWVETLIVARPSVGTLLIDDLWLTIAPASTRMAATRSGDTLLPPPTAPDGFRGSN